MKNTFHWFKYGVEKYIRDRSAGITDRWYSGEYRYCRRRILPCNAANDEVLEKLLNDVPFTMGRYGYSELAAMRNFEFGRTSNYIKTIHQIWQWSGFFPDDISLGDEFLREMLSSLEGMDYLLASGEPFENYFIDRYSGEDITVVPGFQLAEPWLIHDPEKGTDTWSTGLKGKRVLVVHPFTDSIMRQYDRHGELFPGTDILPDFTLILYKPFMSIGGLGADGCETWFEALDKMWNDVKNIDFDVALLGCGAYGFPLAARIGSLGRTAVHMGGSLQILFGVMGRRWDGSRYGGVEHMNKKLKRYYNEAWIYPSVSETPEESKNVEYGPYWK